MSGAAGGPADDLKSSNPLDLAAVGPRRWVDAMSMYAFVALGLPDGMIGTAWPAVRSGFGVPLDGLGVVLLVGTLGAVCSSSVSGLVVARLGIRPTVIVAGLVACLGAFGAIVSPAFWAFIVAGAAIGVTAGLMDSSLNTAVALAGRNRLLNVLHGWYGIGTTIGPLVVTAAILTASWRPAYAFLLVAEMVLVIGWWLVGRRGSPAPTPGAAVRATDGPGGGGIATAEPSGHSIEARAGCEACAEPATEARAEPATTSGSGRDVAVSRPGAGPGMRPWVIVALGLSVFMVYTGFEVSAGQWAPSFDRSTLHLGPAATGVATFGYWAALTLVRFGLAAPRRPLPQVAIVRWGCVIAVAGAVLVWWQPAAMVAVIGLVVIGAGLAGVFPALVALTPARVGDEMARHVIGWQIGAASIGGAAISALFGAVFQRYGLQYFGPALVVVAALTLLGSLVLESASKRVPKPTVVAVIRR